MCEEHGIAFVGPPAAAICAMGDKSEAKVGGGCQLAFVCSPACVSRSASNVRTTKRPAVLALATRLWQALMDGAGVPVVPGYHSEDQAEGRLQVGRFVVDCCMLRSGNV